MKIYRWWPGATRVLAVVLAGLLVQMSARPCAGDAKAEAAAAATSVKAAVDALKKEFAARQLRDKCDFSISDSSDATVEAIFAALESSPGSSVEENAYIKWQLLAGVGSPVNGQRTLRLLRIYSQAPALVPDPSLDRQTRSQLDAMTHVRVRPADQANFAQQAETINQEWAAKVAKALEPNKVIVAYRDELFARLPPSTLTIKAGMQDGCDRANAGVSGLEIMDRVHDECRDWVAAGASPAEMREVKVAVDKVVMLLGGPPQPPPPVVTGRPTYISPPVILFPPSIYKSLRLDTQGKWGWQNDRARFIDVRKMFELSKYLGDCIKHPNDRSTQ